MSKRIKISSRERVVVYGEDDKAPFWIEHIGTLIVIGLIVVVGGMVILALSDWGRATMVVLCGGQGGTAPGAGITRSSSRLDRQRGSFPCGCRRAASRAAASIRMSSLPCPRRGCRVRPG